MKLRKSVLISCITMAFILFINGLYLLVLGNNRAPQKNIPNEYSQTKFERVSEENNPRGQEPVNILVLGLDEEGVRSDVIILMNFNPSNGGLNILSIARDTRLTIKRRSHKINAMIGMGGEKLAAEKVEEITELPIHYYLTINFKGFKKMVDVLDGVEINVPFDMDYDDPEQNLHIHLKKGKQVLDGDKAEQFVRYRKGNRRGQGYTDGDIGRIKMQQEFIKALLEQKLKLRYLSKADDIFFILKKYMRTNIEIGDANYYLKYMKNINYDEIKTFTLPGDSDYIKGVWYFIHHEEQTKRIIEQNFYK